MARVARRRAEVREGFWLRIWGDRLRHICEGLDALGETADRLWVR